MQFACQADCRHHSSMEELPKAAMPPDEDLADLIEQAVLDGQIDGERADQAYL